MGAEPAANSERTTGHVPAQPSSGTSIGPTLAFGGLAGDLLWLQRTTGNQVVHRLLSGIDGGGPRPSRLVRRLSVVQRGPGAPAAEDQTDAIQAAIKADTLQAVWKLKDFGNATDPQKIQLIRIVLREQRSSQEAAWTTLYRLWDSFGTRLPQVVEGGASAEWEQSMDSGYALMKGVPEVKKRTDDFTKDIKQFASKNLADNRDYVLKELEKVGKASEAKDAPNAEQQKEIRRGMQTIAYDAWILKDSQNKMKELEVGWTGAGLGAKVAKFDPNTPPAYVGLFSKPKAHWPDVKKDWDESQGKLLELSGKYPEIYEALAQDDTGAAVLQFSRLLPETFYASSDTMLKNLGLRIDKAQKIIDDQGVNYLDLVKVHEALYGGMYASNGRNWAGGFDQRLAKKLVARHAADEKAMASLLDTAAMTALIIASFASGGLALALAGVAVAIPAGQAAAASSQANKLETLSKATPMSGTALVAQIQVDMASAEATAKMVQAVTNALMLGAPLAVEAIQVIRLKALVGDAELLAKLQARVPNAAQLERLLKQVKTPEELETLLKTTTDVAKLEELLTLRQQFRQRFAERWEADRAAIEKIKADNPALKDIPTEDLVAIRGYTGNDSALLNRALRGQATPEEMAHLEPYIKTATAGLDHLPRYVGTVTRREVNTAGNYQVGKEFTQEGFMSTSMPGGKFSREATVELKIESTNGRVVEQISPHAGEKEVLFKPGTRFTVVSKTHPYSPAHTVVHLKEL